MSLGYLKPTPKILLVFLILILLLFSRFYSDQYLGLWYSAILVIRGLLFWPIMILLWIGPFFVGRGSDFIYTPTYWLIICYALGVIYAYLLSIYLVKKFFRKILIKPADAGFMIRVRRNCRRGYLLG